MRKRYRPFALALLFLPPAPMLVLSSACDSDPVEPDPVDERAVMETIYRKMNGDGWYRRDNWNTDAPLDAWYGVGTDAGGNVISLEMRANRVRGVLAPELAMLQNLKSLVLNDNGLTGSVPPELGDLQNLEKLILSANYISGAIPPGIYRLGSSLFWRSTETRWRGRSPPNCRNSRPSRSCTSAATASVGESRRRSPS